MSFVCMLFELSTEGPTELSSCVSGVEIAVRIVTAKNKADEWHRGVLEGAKRFMVKWYNDEVELSRKCHASAVGGAQGNGRGGGEGATIVREFAVGRKQEGDSRHRLEMYQADYSSTLVEPV